MSDARRQLESGEPTEITGEPRERADLTVIEPTVAREEVASPDASAASQTRFESPMRSRRSNDRCFRTATSNTSSAPTAPVGSPLGPTCLRTPSQKRSTTRSPSRPSFPTHWFGGRPKTRYSRGRSEKWPSAPRRKSRSSNRSTPTNCSGSRPDPTATLSSIASAEPSRRYRTEASRIRDVSGAPVRYSDSSSSIVSSLAVIASWVT